MLFFILVCCCIFIHIVLYSIENKHNTIIKHSHTMLFKKIKNPYFIIYYSYTFCRGSINILFSSCSSKLTGFFFYLIYGRILSIIKFSCFLYSFYDSKWFGIKSKINLLIDCLIMNDILNLDSIHFIEILIFFFISYLVVANWILISYSFFILFIKKQKTNHSFEFNYFIIKNSYMLFRDFVCRIITNKNMIKFIQAVKFNHIFICYYSIEFTIILRLMYLCINY